MLYLFFRQQEYLMVKNIGQIQYFLPYKRYERRGWHLVLVYKVHNTLRLLPVVVFAPVKTKTLKCVFVKLNSGKLLIALNLIHCLYVYRNNLLTIMILSHRNKILIIFANIWSKQFTKGFQENSYTEDSRKFNTFIESE